MNQAYRERVICKDFMVIPDDGIVIIDQDPTTTMFRLPSDENVSYTDVPMEHPLLVRKLVS
jgi:hypothetical protein